MLVAPTHREEGILLTEKSAYSPESGFPEATLHARSPPSTGLERIKDLCNPEPGIRETRGQFLTSILFSIVHVSELSFVRCSSSLEIFLLRYF